MKKIWYGQTLQFFNIFTFPLIKGDPNTALIEPNSAVLSEEMAHKYFGDGDPLNNTLMINEISFTVTGVMHNVPRTSHFDANMFLSMVTLERMPELQERYFKM